MKKIVTLCLVEKDEQVLLGMKKRGFGEGLYNGFGGKVDTYETIEGAAARELFEEAGVTALTLEKIGILEFSFAEEPTLELVMHIFKTNNFSGAPIESPEMKPRWFSINAIPYSHMWTSDIVWFPLFLSGQKFTGKFRFDKPGGSTHTAHILEQILTPVESLKDSV